MVGCSDASGPAPGTFRAQLTGARLTACDQRLDLGPDRGNIQFQRDAGRGVRFGGTVAASGAFSAAVGP